MLDAKLEEHPDDAHQMRVLITLEAQVEGKGATLRGRSDVNAHIGGILDITDPP